MDVYIARQPIFDRDYNLFAYELLYRDSDENVFKGHIADNVATSLLLINSFVSFSFENLIGDGRAFINFDKDLINHGVVDLLDKDHVTIEILETVEPDVRFLKRIKKLKEAGYCFALDDYYYKYPYESLVDAVDLIKIDFFASSKDEIAQMVKNLKAKGKQLLAEKVETKEEFEWAKDLGFDYFQGYYFSKPKMEKRKSMSESGLQYMKLMNELNAEEPNFKSISKVILSDVSLTYKLLKLVNSSSKPISTISSVQQAIAVLGVKQFRRWLSLAMVKQMADKETNELVKFALIRSTLLMSIAEHSKLRKSSDELSLLGTLSIIDVMLEMDMVDALKTLPIDEELKETLLGQVTKYSDAMALCMAYEKGQFDTVETAASNLGYPLELLPEHYVSAIASSDKIFRHLE